MISFCNQLTLDGKWWFEIKVKIQKRLFVINLRFSYFLLQQVGRYLFFFLFYIISTLCLKYCKYFCFYQYVAKFRTLQRFSQEVDIIFTGYFVVHFLQINKITQKPTQIVPKMSNFTYVLSGSVIFHKYLVFFISISIIQVDKISSRFTVQVFYR